VLLLLELPIFSRHSVDKFLQKEAFTLRVNRRLKLWLHTLCLLKMGSSC
jgi:hypothetical protein